MRRLLLAGLLALAPVAPASAGPATCTVTNGFPVCAGTCRSGDTISVRVVGIGQGVASCGGVSPDCYSARVSCTDSATATSSGALTCSGASSAVVFCTASTPAAT